MAIGRRAEVAGLMGRWVGDQTSSGGEEMSDASGFLLGWGSFWVRLLWFWWFLEENGVDEGCEIGRFGCRDACGVF